MSTYRMTKRPLWTSLLVLLHLFAVLLPASARPVSAQVTSCGDTSVQAASVPTITVASADQKVTIPKETLEKALQTTVWSQRHKFAENMRGSFLSQFVIVGFQSTGEVDILSAEAQLEFVNRLESAFPSTELAYLDGPPLDDYIHTMFDIALGIPEFQRLVPLVWNNWHEHLYKQAEGRPASDAAYIGASVTRYSLSDRMEELTYQLITKAYDCAQVNPEFAEFFDKLHSDDRIGSILDSADKILADNPDLPVPPAIRDGIREDGTIEISLDDLKELSITEFAKIHDSIDDIQKSLKEFDAKQNSIIDYLSNQAEKQMMQELAKKKAEETQLKLDAAKASIAIITTIATQIDPKVAKQINVTGNSLLQVAQAINSWRNAVSGLKTLDKIASLSTVVMTGNVLSAVMNIYSVFGPQEPTPEQMILEEIGKLREQVDQLRTEMHERFDRIDQGLNAIYTTMHERFDQIDIQLGKIDGNIQEVQQSLLSLDLQLSRIERNNFELINALGRRPLLEAINGGLGYEDRTGELMPYQPEFVEFENALHTWATIHAFDPLNAGPTQRDYSDAQVLAELSAYPLDSNLNYLNGWLMAQGLTPISNKPLPSPRDWLFATRAYTQLGLEWPEHITRIDPQRQTELEEIGIELETAMQKLSTQLTQAGPLGNTLLFSTVITYYQGKFDSMDSAIQQIESSYVNELQFNYLQRAEPFDIYGGSTQPLSYVTPEISNLTCGDAAGYGTYPLSSNLKAMIPNFDLYNLADYLRLGRFTACLTDEWINPVEECLFPPNDLPVCYFLAHHKSILTLYFDAVPLMSQTIDEDKTVMPTSNADRWTRDQWSAFYNYKAKFEALTTADQPTPEMMAQQTALFNTVTDKVEGELAKYQQGLYGRILTEMTQGSLKSRATELAGSKALLDSVVSLGLPRAVGNDEFLHAMLFGNQRLVEDGQIIQSYALSITQPITAMNVLVNPRLVMQQTADERTLAFSGMVDEYLDAITANTHTEAADYIADTRRVFDLTMRIAQVDLPTPPTTPTPPVTPEPPVTPTPLPPGQPLPPLPANATHSYLPMVER